MLLRGRAPPSQVVSVDVLTAWAPPEEDNEGDDEDTESPGWKALEGPVLLPEGGDDEDIEVVTVEPAKDKTN